LRSEAKSIQANAKVNTRIKFVREARRKETKMAPTAQQLSSEWMTEAEKETEKDRLIRKSKQSPFIPIGELSDFK